MVLRFQVSRFQVSGLRDLLLILKWIFKAMNQSLKPET